ncbi:protein abrupt isoform X2 [Anastrepha ludens]|uniref:protein abrupt isoform X2 n=1 Tax=Anastrepha ludens TaxID=28586 RepID=UPI0023B1137D|nr:protein abrupt isoform X2 [Anastrepha ludens]
MCSVSPNLIPMEQKQEISLPEKLTIHQQHHQQYALKWSDFHSSILNCFQRLRDEEDFVDVTLSCDQRSFNAHRVVLSACSPYFRKLLKSNPCKHPIVILRDVHSENMECLLSFMYNGEVNVRHDQLPDFLKTAHLLQIRGLTDVSESWHSSGFISSEKKPIDTSLDTKCKRDFDKDICEVNSAEKCSFFPNSKPTSERPIASTMVTNYSSSTSNNTPLMKESKTSATACLQWDNTDVIRSRKNHLTPPPQKRIKSADLFRAQHGIGSERALSEREFPAIVQHSFTRDRKHFISDCDQSIGTNENNMEPSMNEEKTLQNQHIDIESMGDESADDKSNSSDEETLERIDRHPEINDSMDPPRPATHNTFLRVPKTLEQHPILNLNDFGTQRSVEIRVRATDPRPCPKCGKIYRSAHTLRTHLEDKHTVCPGYRCVLCGTVAKSRNSLHSHMSRQHRGISTKDLPVLPMPCAFDPILASRLLAKAGVKISPDDLHDRASSANSNSASGPDYFYSNQNNIGTCEKSVESDDDPEDLTAGSASFCGASTGDDVKQKSLLDIEHANTAIARIRSEAAIAAAAAAFSKQKELSSSHSTTNQPLLDLHLLQFLTENTFGMGISQEHATAATLHAAKMAHLNAIGQSFENMPPTLMHPHLDLSKDSITKDAFTNKGCRPAGLPTEPILRQQLSSGTSLGENIQMLAESMSKEQNPSDVSPSINECQSKEGPQNLDNKNQTLYKDVCNFEHEKNNFEGKISPKA